MEVEFVPDLKGEVVLPVDRGCQLGEAGVLVF